MEALERAGREFDEFLRVAQETVVSELGFDVCVFASVDPATALETSCEMYGMPKDPDRELRIFQLEWFSDDPNRFLDLARSPLPAAALRLTTDPTQVKRYVELYEPNGAHDELRLACVADGVWWATLSGFRGADSPAFSAEDVERAAGFSAPLARGFRGAFLLAAVDNPGNLDRPPGAFTIDPSGRIVTTTATAESWLDTMDPNRVPTLVRALAVEVERSGTASVTNVGHAGPLTFHGSPVKGTDENISVIVEYPRPIHLTPLIVTAYDLTRREQEVAELVLEGLVTKQIARRLEISEYTVQDHLKSVFAKTDTATRGELSARLYTRFYLPPRDRGATPGPYGYFLSD